MTKYNFEQGKCKICHQQFANSRGRNTHLRAKHPDCTVEQYYIRYYPQFCKVCGKLIPFKGEKYLQYIFCSKPCLKKDFSEKEPPAHALIKKYKKEYLLNLLKELHEKYKGFVTQRLVRSETGINYQIYHDYFGSFREACKQAGVPSFTRTHHTHEEPIESLLTIQIDAREQIPYPFKNMIRKSMNVGDYKLVEIETGVVIERKGLHDLKGCLGGSVKRFAREMDRAREQNLHVVVLVDASFEEFIQDAHYGKMTNNQLNHNLKKFSSIYADVCQFLFTGNRINSANLVYKLCVLDPECLKGVDLQLIYDEKRFDNYFFGI